MVADSPKRRKQFELVMLMV